MIVNYIQGGENIVLFLRKSSNCLDTIEHVGYTLFNLSFCELNKPFLRHVTNSEFIVILKQRSNFSYCYNPFVYLKFNHKMKEYGKKSKIHLTRYWPETKFNFYGSITILTRSIRLHIFLIDGISIYCTYIGILLFKKILDVSRSN